MHLHAELRRVVGELVEPSAAGRAHRVEAARAPVHHEEHRIVGDVAEEAREQVHLRHAREVVARELGEIEHGDLPVLLLHLRRARQVRAGLPRGLGSLERTPGVGVLLELGLCRRGRRGASATCGGLAAAHAGRPGTLFEERADRVRVRRDSVERVAPRSLLRQRRLARREHDGSGGDAGACRLEEVAPIEGGRVSRVHGHYEISCRVPRPPDELCVLRRRRPRRVARARRRRAGAFC